MNDSLPSPVQPRQRRGSALLVVAIAAIGVILLAVFYYGILNPPSARVGSGKAPDISFTNYSFGLTEYDGKTVRLSDFRGKPIVLNFWASWCVPCREEQAILQASWQKHGSDVLFMGVDYLDQPPNAQSYLTEFGVTYPNGPDKGSRAYTSYRVQGVPETFFIDADGNVQGFYVGPIPAMELEQRIQALLKS